MDDYPTGDHTPRTKDPMEDCEHARSTTLPPYHEKSSTTPGADKEKVARDDFSSSNESEIGVIERDAVFGTIHDKGPNYRNVGTITIYPFKPLYGAERINQVGFLGTIALMIKTQFGLGVLTIPDVFNTLGMIPGVICLIAIGSVTTWSNYMVGVFKRKHPEVYGIDDAGGLMFGRVGREIFAFALCVCMYLPTSEHGWGIYCFTNVSQIGSFAPDLVCLARPLDSTRSRPMEHAPQSL